MVKLLSGEKYQGFQAFPFSKKNYSGKFLVRISPEIHRDLAVKASEHGISLNNYVSAKLAVG